jgi:hypothetical protein
MTRKRVKPWLVGPWMGIGLDAWRLGLEAQSVIALRTFKVATGGDANGAESALMVREKLASAATLQTLALTGRLGATPAGAAAKTLAHYRRKVRANRRRLLKG